MRRLLRLNFSWQCLSVLGLAVGGGGDLVGVFVHPYIVGALEPRGPFEVGVLDGLVLKESVDDLAIGVYDWAGKAVSVFSKVAHWIFLSGLGSCLIKLRTTYAYLDRKASRKMKIISPPVS